METWCGVGTGQAHAAPLHERSVSAPPQTDSQHPSCFVSQQSAACLAMDKTAPCTRPSRRGPHALPLNAWARKYPCPSLSKACHSCLRPRLTSAENPSPRRPSREVATPSKICAARTSTPARARASPVRARPPTAQTKARAESAAPDRHPFSAHANSAGTLQHASYRMPTSMATALLSPFASSLTTAARQAPYPHKRLFPLRMSCLPEHAHYATQSRARTCATDALQIRSLEQVPSLYLPDLF